MNIFSEWLNFTIEFVCCWNWHQYRAQRKHSLPFNKFIAIKWHSSQLSLLFCHWKFIWPYITNRKTAPPTTMHVYRSISVTVGPNKNRTWLSIYCTFQAARKLLACVLHLPSDIMEYRSNILSYAFNNSIKTAFLFALRLSLETTTKNGRWKDVGIFYFVEIFWWWNFCL